MSKKPRRTLSDVATGLRDLSSPEPLAVSEAAPEKPVDHSATCSREHVATSGDDKPKGFNRRKERIEKPHQSVYAHPVVFRELRKMAAAEGIKPQDLYREGLRHVFAERGLDFDKLDRGEEI